MSRFLISVEITHNVYYTEYTETVKVNINDDASHLSQQVYITKTVLTLCFLFLCLNRLARFSRFFYLLGAVGKES